MPSRRNSLLILGLVAILLAAAVYLIFIRQPVSQATQLGLDLRGGVSVQLEGYRTDGSEVQRNEMERAVQVIRERVDSLGVTEPEIQLQGQDQVSVNIPGITDTQRAVEVIGRTAQLGLYEVLAYDQQPNVPKSEIGGVEDDLRQSLKDDSEFEKGKTKILFEESPAIEGEGTDVSGYIVSEQPQITGGALDSATVGIDNQGKRIVQMDFTRKGGQQFTDLSQKISQSTLGAGEPGRLAIVLDNSVESAPVVEQAIPGGQVSISNDALPGGLPQDEAESLQVVLETGALPVNMRVLSVTTIGATLGAASLAGGLIAAGAGFALVLGFLMVIYRALGVVASAALMIYAFLLWGIIVAVPITITLPGIAGVVLALGVAADANIVIFERVKEEVRRGKTPRSAIALGYQKGFRAILDGNLTTIIVAMILFGLSSGSVRGFAVLLSIGVVLSMFTAVVVTRALLGLISSRGGLNLTPRMLGVSPDSVRSSGRGTETGEKARVR
jgi:protein-export membrane protein SecD